MQNIFDTFIFILRAAAPLTNIIYKVLLLGVLIWIGYGLQDVTAALKAGTEACVIDPEAMDGGSGESGGLVKPLFHG
jgi:hypothetical protein